MPETNVKLYALSTCIHCRNTKQFLKDNKVAYDCVDVDTLTGDDRKRIVEEIKKYNPAMSFPPIIIGDKVIVGFQKEDILKLLGL